MTQKALITGASSGIGMSCAKYFAKAGYHLILAARRIERLNELKQELNKLYPHITVELIQLDVREREEVSKKLSYLTDIDILINNAGLSSGLEPVQDGDIDDWEKMIDTNIKGLLYVTRAITPGMVAKNKGHIINIGSIAGHEIYPGGNVYCATKHAVVSLSKAMRIDLFGTDIRVTEIDPGMVETEFSLVRFHGDKEKADSVYEGMQPLTADDIADVILYCASCPPHVNISEVVIMPTAQARVGMVKREK